jgi:hypothetical protein
MKTVSGGTLTVWMKGKFIYYRWKGWYVNGYDCR